MDWLSPMTGLVAAAVAVPALVLLYFLKLKRRDMPVSSTLLWKRAVQDLQVNAPFQRLRRNILLVLQLLALAAMLAALGRPVLSLSAGPAKRYVLLIDHSASMNATDLAPTRLAEAKRQARTLVDSLRSKRTWYLSDESDEAMVIAFGPEAKVLCNYTSDKRQLAAAIEAIEPTDGESRLAEAMTVAQAFAAPAGAEDKGRPAVAPATLELFTDGRLTDLDDVSAPPGTLTYHRIGASRQNVAVVAMRARRSYEQPEKLTAFVNLANFGPEPVTCDVQLSIDASVRAVRPATIPALEPGRPGQPARPGHAAVSFVLAHPQAGVIEVRALSDDPLPGDNVAWGVVEAPGQLYVALVTEGNEPLASALRACPLAKTEVLSAAKFEQLYADAGEAPYGLVVLDRVTPKKLPRGNYLVFGPPPEASGAKAVGELKNRAIADWQDKHPVLNFVNLENLFAARAWKLDVPRDALVLAQFEDSPALVMTRRGGGLWLLAAFDVLQSNWPFDAGFVMFCYNAIHFVASESGDVDRHALKAGQPITVQAKPGQKRAALAGPGGLKADLVASPSGLLRWARTLRAGVYRLAIEGGPETAVAVNLMDERESDIAPADELACSGQVVKAQRSAPAPANRELWPLLVALALAVVLVEWYVYCAKVRL
jgi:hypothetical protein